MTFVLTVILTISPLTKLPSHRLNITVWAIALMCHAACSSFGSLFAVRFILGICEGSVTAGFMIVRLQSSFNARTVEWQSGYEYVLHTGRTNQACWIVSHLYTLCYLWISRCFQLVPHEWCRSDYTRLHQFRYVDNRFLDRNMQDDCSS
jgi:hypothetical protein